MRSWRIGRAFGIGIYVHWTFLLLLGFVAFRAWGLEEGPGSLHAAVMLVLVFTSVVLHELGHALMARRFGVGTRDITLYPIGGIARLERMPEKPWEELCIAVAGPAVNVVIAALLLIPLFLAVGVHAGMGELVQFARANYLINLIQANIFLVLFNMLPAFPMDGGRVLRALLILPFGRLMATSIAATIGAMFALFFALTALYFGNIMLMILGLFLFVAGQQELAYVRFQAGRDKRHAHPSLPLTTDILDVVPVPVETAFNGAVWDQSHRVWVLWQDGRPVRTFWMPGSQG